jgi:NAD dependent epimerase/dehydratase family enzyme
MGLGIITDIITGGKRVTPAKLSALGYQFKFPALDAALHDVLGQPDNTAAAAP